MRLNWSSKPAVLIGGGPSLAVEQVDYARQSDCYILAINNAYQLCPDAAALYACDRNWWEHYRPDFAGTKYSLEYGKEGVFKMSNTGQNGIETAWPGIRTGSNSGYQAINLAVHFGCKKIILIGYDMQHTGGKRHWHPDHPKSLKNSPGVSRWRRNFEDAAMILEDMGIGVINCTIQTALTCFWQADIREVL